VKYLIVIALTLAGCGGDRVLNKRVELLGDNKPPVFGCTLERRNYKKYAVRLDSGRIGNVAREDFIVTREKC